MKTIFRQAAKKSHPDAVLPRFREAASDVFCRLRAAHDAGDLATVRKLAEQIATGLFEGKVETGEGSERQKQLLRTRICSLREALVHTRLALEGLTRSITYRHIIENPEWDEFFERERHKLAREVAQLKEMLGSSWAEETVTPLDSN